MSKKREKFEAMRAAYFEASQAASSELITQSLKYGGDRNARSWASRGDKMRLEKLEAKRDRIGDKIVDFIVKESPRGESWRSGVPSHWLTEKLAWDDIVKPANEELSTLPPTAYGWTTEELRRHLGAQRSDDLRRMMGKGA